MYVFTYVLFIIIRTIINVTSQAVYHATEVLKLINGWSKLEDYVR